ncbi:hypothetical protein SNE510_42580 [Streptomyces sp. NE5-10]|nr:hypothetical protein SNE510_42580 [Streptomyces sp. NE5-10]
MPGAGGFQPGRDSYPYSEPLRLDQREDEVSQQGGGDEQTDHVLGTHSFATPLAMNATSAKTATVVTTKATSAIVNSRKKEERIL